jgi:hypothetical protein
VVVMMMMSMTWLGLVLIQAWRDGTRTRTILFWVQGSRIAHTHTTASRGVYYKDFPGIYLDLQKLGS